MIDSQKVLFESFKLEFVDSVRHSSSAVNELESILIDIKQANGSISQIKRAIEAFDDNDQIFSVTRTFCIIVKNINEKISLDNDFTLKDKMDYYETLINFTDYSLFKLILISSKYLEYKNLDVINHKDFQDVLEAIGVKDYLDKI